MRLTAALPHAAERGQRMALITWKEAYSVGVAAIDRDHRLLLNLINQLHDAQETAQTHDMVSSVLTVLTEYVQRHFSAEEALMERGGYPHLEAHRKEHRRIESRVREMKALYDAGEYAVVESDMLRFFTQWLANHIVGVDTRFRPWVEPVAHLIEDRMFAWPEEEAAPA